MTFIDRFAASGLLRSFFAVASAAAWLASPSANLAQSKSARIEVSRAAPPSAASRLGATPGGEAYVDGGPLRKNLIVGNPGFEATEYRAILRCEAVMADGCRVSDAGGAGPDGSWKDAGYRVMSGASAGAAGRVVSQTYGNGGLVLALDKSLSLSAGDYLSVEVQRSAGGAAGWAGSANGGGIATETADPAPETPGKQELDAQPDRSKLRLNGAYELGFRAKGAGSTSSARASATPTRSSPRSSKPAIDYPNGFAGSPSTIWLESFATYSGSSIHLVPSVVHNASNAWYKTPENVQSFTTAFTFHVVCPAAPTPCGDGFGFMIISDPNPSTNTQSGGSDPGFTYQGYSSQQFSWSRCATVPAVACPAPGQPAIDSILVKFDLYNNAAHTPGANLTGYYADGQLPQLPLPEYDMAPSGIDIQSGHEFACTLTYDGATLTESLTDTATGAHYANSYAADIPSTVLGNSAFVGFGGGTGEALDDVYLDSWTYAAATSAPAGNRHGQP